MKIKTCEMNDLISRAAAIGCLGNSPEQMCMPWSEIERMLRELPAVDAVPVVHGTWIGVEYDGYADGLPVYDLWECSVCGEEHDGDFDSLTNYCPNCGAKMDGERREEDEG